ncbi:MAG: hypothetical protein ABSF70_11315 [Terracidiphilus sp.]
MEISPVTGVRIAPMIRPKEAFLGLTDVYEVERSSRTGDETYSPSGSKAASGYEEDEDKFDDPDAEADAESDPKTQPAEIRPIRFVA